MYVNGFEWSGKKVMVTGASGFKGSWLCQVLKKLGADVYGITRQVLNPMSSYNLFELKEKIVEIPADITIERQVFDILNVIVPEVIFHLAAKAQVPVALRDPIRTFDVNIMGTLNLLEGCRKFQIGEKLLIISTDHVFGFIPENYLPEGGFSEIDRVSFGGPYDTSKSAMELCVRSYYSCYSEELPAIGITRAANVFGYGDVAYRRVIPNFVRSVLRDKFVPLTYRKNGRQFIHITDIIEGYIRTASILAKPSKNLNQFTQEFMPTFHFAIQDYEKDKENFIRVEELANLVASIFNAVVREQEGCLDYAPNENPVQALNCQDTFNRLNWQPGINMRTGISELKEWYAPAHEELEQNRRHEFLGTLMEEEANRIVSNLTK